MSSQDDLEWEWEVVSVHETGHAVALVVLGLALREVRIGARSTWTGVDSSGAATGSWPDDLDDTEDVDLHLVTCLAGAAAEMAFGSRDAAAHAQGDIALAEQLLPYSTLTLGEAEAEAHRLVYEHWDVIVEVAEALRDADGYLSGADVEGIILSVAA